MQNDEQANPRSNYQVAQATAIGDLDITQKTHG